MNWKTYQELSPKTLVSFYHSYALNTLEDPSLSEHIPGGIIRSARQLAWGADLAHMVEGMTSEIDELIEAINKNDKVGISEELADMLWYVSGTVKLFSDHGINLTLCKTYNFTEEQSVCNIKDLAQAISAYSDIPKKILAYKRIVRTTDDSPRVEKVYYESDIDAALMVVLYRINCLANMFYIDINKALQNNIDKLQGVRYKDGFNTEDANNRNLEQERKELEKN